MSKIPYHQAIGRLLEILKKLPARGAGISARELTEWLHDEGFEVSKRTVERDLNALAAHFQVIYNDRSMPYGWRWMDDAVADLPALTLADALSLRLVEEQLAPLLPAALLTSLLPRFRQARRKLDSLAGQHPGSRWPDKVRSVAPALPLQTPRFADGVLETVQEALLFDRQLEVSYRRPGEDEPLALTLHPLALVQRGPVTYLVATAFTYEDVRLYAVHRMTAARFLDTPSHRPEGFSLDDYIAHGGMQFGDGATLRLEAWVAPWLAEILMETPLADDQQLVPEGEDFRLTATVADSWQLRWWILSQGAGLTVLEPDTLRREITQTLKRTLKGYRATTTEV